MRLAVSSMLRLGLATMLALAVVAVVPSRADATQTAPATELTVSATADVPDFVPLCTAFRPRTYGYIYLIEGYRIEDFVNVDCHVAYSPTECEWYAVQSTDGGQTWYRHPYIRRVWCFT